MYMHVCTIIRRSAILGSGHITSTSTSTSTSTRPRRPEAVFSSGWPPRASLRHPNFRPKRPKTERLRNFRMNFVGEVYHFADYQFSEIQFSR